MSICILLRPEHPNDPSEGRETLLVVVELSAAEIDFLLQQQSDLERRQKSDRRLLGVELACGSIRVLTRGLGEISDDLLTQSELLEEQDLVVVQDPELLAEIGSIEWDDTVGDTAHLDVHGVRWTTSADEMEYRSAVVSTDDLRGLVGK